MAAAGSIDELVGRAESELSKSGSHFSPAENPAIGRQILATLRERYPEAHLEGFWLQLEKVYVLWSDDRLGKSTDNSDLKKL